MKNNLKNESAFSTVDIVISIGIISIFITIITFVYTNLNISNLRIERNQIATNYAISILEKADELYYSEVTQENFQTMDLQNGKHQVAGIEIASGYNVSVVIDKFNIEQDVIKTITVDVKYKVGKKEETLELSKIKEKEVLKTPNEPLLEDDMTPVKFIRVTRKVYSEETGEYEEITTRKLVKTDSKDSSWYDYSNRKWALAIKGSDESNIFVWIPRFAYRQTENNINIKFIYYKGQRFVNENGDLEQLPVTYTISNDFGTNTGIWIPINNVLLNNVSNLLNSSDEYGPMLY